MIKKLFFVFVFCVSSLFAAEVATMPSYAAALQVAKKDDKNIVLMLSQPGCPACIYMKTVTFKSEEVAVALKNFVVVDVNIHKDEWNKKYRAFGTPTLYFLDKNENKIGKPIIGALESADFVQVIKALQSGKQ